MIRSKELLSEGQKAMKTLQERLRRFLASETGPTAVEYAVMLALILLVCLVAISVFGIQTSTMFNNSANSLGTVAGS
jgi:pilus assembly protein Flp/PilA